MGSEPTFSSPVKFWKEFAWTSYLKLPNLGLSRSFELTISVGNSWSAWFSFTELVRYFDDWTSSDEGN